MNIKDFRPISRYILPANFNPDTNSFTALQLRFYRLLLTSEVELIANYSLGVKPWVYCSNWLFHRRSEKNDHTILCMKLVDRFELSTSAVSLVQSYLRGRQQTVEFGGHSSSYHTLLADLKA